jgi:gliding motility-associated-like protein
MRKIILLALVFLTSSTAFGQDFSNKGKDFWVGYGYHQQMTNGGGGGSQDMVLYFATEQVTNITISIPATGYVQNITTGAGNGVVTSATIPKTGVNDARLLTDGLSSKGIHVTSDKPMVAYAHVYNTSVSGATILYPTNTLGREYYSVNYKNWSNSANSNCWFYVVAADTGTTTVKITPTGNTTGGWVAGTSYTVTLTQGQIYNVMGSLLSSPNACNPVCTAYDLTGSKVESINNGSGCKKIAVFSGSGRISITCNNNNSSSDNYMVQAMPKNAWGKKYLTLPAYGNQAYNIYRVCVSNPAALVKVNGVVTALPLQNNFYYEIPSTNQPMLIEADSSIMVAQYFTSQNACLNGNPGDPEVIYLSAVEQNINKVLWNATPNFAITSHDFNVVIPNTGTAITSFKLDGVTVPAASFTVHPQDPGYSYLRYRLTIPAPIGAGFHYIESDSGFNAIAYGFGSAESYGYNAGTNIKDLYQQIGVHTQYGIETSPSVCTNSPFKFKVSLPYIPDSMHWDFHNAVGMMPNNATVYVDNTGNIAEDSVTTVNGRTIHWYSVPLQYTFTTVGVYSVTITTFVPNGECGSVQDIDFDLTVSDPPVADFAWTAGGCVAETYQFNETTPQFPKPTYYFYWNFDDAGSGASNTSGLRNPTHLFSTPGIHNVKYFSITTPGCFSDTIIHQINVPDFPNATVAGNTTVCINSVPFMPVTFTGTDGTAEYVFSYNINGGATLTTPTSTGGIFTINAPTNIAGPFTYNLTGVRNAIPAGTLCTRVITGQSVTVNITPDATVTLRAGDNNNQTVCINNPIANIRYDVGGSGTGGAVSGLPAGVTGSYAAGVITIAGTPTTAGIFNYTVTTTGPCLTPQATGTITVNDDATISLVSPVGSDNQTKCINTPIDNIDYQVVGIGTGATIAWAPAVPAGISFTNLGGGNFRIAGTPTSAGTFNYTINTTGPCIKPTATGSLVVNADATLTLRAGDNNNQTICINNPMVNIRYDVGGSGTGGAVSGLPAGVTGIYAAGVITISGTPTAAGVFNYTVTTTGPCVTPQATGTITVTGDGTITLSSAVGSDNQTLCVNTPLLINITYSVAGTSTGGAVSGLPAGVTGVYAAGVISISGTPTTAGVFNYTVSTTGPCVNPVATGTITVTGDATLTLTSAAGTNNQIRCINVAIANITYSVSGTGTGGSVSGLPPGVTGVFAAGVVTISGTPTAIGAYNYTVTTTGPCVIPTANGTITVNPDASITLTSAVSTTSQELCRNSAITNVTYAISGGGTGAAATGLPAGVTGVYAGGVFTISGTATVAGLFNYTVTTTGTCVQNSLSGTILVNQLPTAIFSYTAPSCQSRIINFNDGSVPNSGALTNWAWNFGDPASGGANTSTLQNPTHVFAGAGIFNVTLTVTTDKGCVSNPIANIPVTVDNRPQAGFIIPEVCLSDTYAQFLDTSKLTNGVLDRWDWNFGDPGSGPLNVSTLQNPTHSYSAVGSYNVRLIVWNFAKGCRDTIMQTLFVNGSFPVANFTVNNAATLCANDSVGIVEASTVFPGTITKIEIYWDNVNFPAVFQTDNSPYTGKIYRHLYPNFQAPLTKVFNIRYRAYSGGVCVNDKLSNITVHAAPRVQFNNMPNTCLLVPPFQITQASETGGVPGNGTYSGTGVSPTGIFSPQVAGIGTHNILYTFTSTAAGCVDTMSNNITVLDTAHAAFTYVLPSCEQVPVSFTDISTAPASVTLANTVWDFGDGTPVENHAPGSTFTHTFALPGTLTVTMHNVSAFGCLSTDTSAVLNIDPNHTISLNAGSNPYQTVCINTPISPIVYTLGGGATGATVTGLPAGVTATVTGNTLTVSGTPTTTVLSPFNFNIVTTGNSCIIATTSGSIAVQPDHSISLNAGSNDNQTVCINTAITPIDYTLGGGATGATVTGLPAGVTASVTGNLLTISGTPTTTVSSPYNFNIVTTGNSCITASAAGTIDVLADHTISLNAGSNNNQTVCINTAISAILYTIGGGATGATVTGLPAGINASVTGNQLTISGAPTTAISSPFSYSIITTGNSCVASNASGIIAVQPDHSIAFNSGDTMQSVCVNTPIDPIVYDLGGGASGATIANLPPGVTYTVAGNIVTISGTPTTTTGGPIFGYTITTSGNGCLKATAIGEIIVNPYPVPFFTVDKTDYCVPNALVGFIQGSTMPDGSPMTYVWDFGDSSPNATSVNASHLYTTQGPFTANLVATSTAVLNGNIIGCSKNYSRLLNAIHPQPKAEIAKNKSSVCIGDVVTFTDDTRGGGLLQQSFWNMGDGTGTQNGNPFTYLYRDTLPSPFIITYYSQDNFGCYSDTITRPFFVYPYPHVNAGPDKLVLEGGSVQLESIVFATDPQYAWTPVQFLTDSRIARPRVENPATDMTYRLTVTSRGGCQLSDDVFVKLLKFPVIPNTFTPNGDGINDKWRIDYLNTYPNNRVQIFTRSGSLVFESRGYNTPWDGTLKGKPLPFDTYYYIIEPGNNRDPITGYVTIIK